MFVTLDSDQLDQVTGAGNGDFPGFNACGPRLYTAGCREGSMSFDEWSAIAYGGKMADGKTATFPRWASWMRKNGYPSSALDRAGK